MSPSVVIVGRCRNAADDECVAPGLAIPASEREVEVFGGLSMSPSLAVVGRLDNDANREQVGTVVITLSDGAAAASAAIEVPLDLGLAPAPVLCAAAATLEVEVFGEQPMSPLTADPLLDDGLEVEAFGERPMSPLTTAPLEELAGVAEHDIAAPPSWRDLLADDRMLDGNWRADSCVFVEAIYDEGPASSCGPTYNAWQSQRNLKCTKPRQHAIAQNAFAALASRGDSSSSDDEAVEPACALDISRVHGLVTRDLLASFFERYGTIVSIAKHMPLTGFGAATVQFSSAGEAAEAAAALQGERLHPTLEPMKLRLGTPMQAWLRARAQDGTVEADLGENCEGTYAAAVIEEYWKAGITTGQHGD